MKLYCINRLNESGQAANQPTMNMIAKACEQHDIELIELISSTFDFANPPQLSKGDLVYCVSIDSLSLQLEKLLLTMGPTSLYKDEIGFWWQDNVVKATAVHKAHNIPINKTIFGASDDRQVLEKSVEELGGFPIVIKVAGGSHGVGIMRADSFPSLLSIVDYLKETTDQQFILRQYIDHKSHARLIVLNGQVIDSIEYISNPGDFRTNSGKEPNVQTKSFDDTINSIAVKAVDVLGLEFGGVDIIIDNEGNPYVVEVNFPCFFPRAQKISGVDIAGKMVAYLKSKAV